jgi:hypothetical protein
MEYNVLESAGMATDHKTAVRRCDTVTVMAVANME